MIAYEYPGGDGDPLYPVPTTSSRELFESYWKLANKEKQANRVYFCGRLAQYVYINSDEAMERALLTFERIRADCEAR